VPYYIFASGALDETLRYFHVFTWRPESFRTLSVFMWHKSPTLELSAHIYLSASNSFSLNYL
jgi:hypothetical protein